MTDSTERALVLGCHGGVGRAVLSLLEHSAVGRRLRERTDAILLVDRDLPDASVPLQAGVLLSSRRFGELWMGFVTDVATGLAYGTNATQLQVAAGVVAGWSQLGRRRGIHFVEDLDWPEFLASAGEVLGSPVVVHDASARPSPLADRVVATPTAVG